jgi:hypothetical protein
MAYKVLGQTLTTAATAPVVLNLIKDPSFEGITRAMVGATSGATAAWSAVDGTQWFYQNHNTTYFSDDKFGDISQLSTFQNSPAISYGTASIRYGTKVVGWGSTSQAGNYSSDNYLAYGLSTSYPASSNANENFGGVTRSIPVAPNTTYYYGCDVMAGNITTSSFRILWFNSSGAHIDTTESNLFSGTSSSSWTRKNFTVVSNPTAAYAGIAINARYLRQTQLCVAMDGIYFGTAASAGSAGAFPDPSTGGTNSTLTAPFTSRFTTTWSGTPNNSTTVTTSAGAAVDLYTVPAGSSAVVSTIAVSNPTTSATSYRVGVVKSGDTLALKSWIAFDIPLSANTTTTLTLGVTLAAGDKIVVSNDTAQVSFTAFGSEN